jgi:hypothetical protein
MSQEEFGPQSRICVNCDRPFTGRGDALTCGARCRKRRARARAALPTVPLIPVDDPVVVARCWDALRAHAQALR